MRLFQRARASGAAQAPLSLESIAIEPIGVVRSSLRDLRHQDASRQRAAIDLLPRHAPALLGLEGFSHLLVLTWLDRVSDEERAVLGEHPGGRRDLPLTGVFALRTHHRPNPIGLTVVRIERVRAGSVDVTGLDVIDGTPVLDLKPYLPPYDAVPEARLPPWAGGSDG